MAAIASTDKTVTFKVARDPALSFAETKKIVAVIVAAKEDSPAIVIRPNAGVFPRPKRQKQEDRMR